MREEMRERDIHREMTERDRDERQEYEKGRTRDRRKKRAR